MLGSTKRPVILLWSALLLCRAMLAQSAAPQLQTFHVQGTIQNISGEPVFRAKVAFQSKEPKKEPNSEQIKVVDTDERGFYQTDLPLGDYTMTAQSLGFRPYRRPFFRVTAPTRLTFDITLRDIAACDVLVFNGPGAVTPDDWAAGQKENCLREDFLPLPSHAAPFQLSLRYGSRAHEHGGYSYSGEKNGKDDIPVFVAYNQFTLQAEKVVFDPHKKTIAASGDVIAWNEPDTIQRAEVASFRIEDDHAVRIDSPPTFHVKGTITGPIDAVVPHMQIKFQSKLLDKTVTSNDVGAYDVDLSVGEYSLIAANNFLKTRRIQFRAASPTTLTVNGIAYPRRLTCDVVVGGPQSEELAKDVCGGEDSFEIPSGDGTFLHLYVQFEQRKRTSDDEEYVYSAAKNTSGDLLTPVFVEYNLFSLRADQVVYDLNTRVLKANGNVVVADESGATERSDSASFKIENGHAKPLR
jgi:hypothetical protein